MFITNIKSQSMEWRMENGIDNLINSWKPPVVLEKYYSNGVIGYDKFGCNGTVRTAQKENSSSSINLLICFV